MNLIGDKYGRLTVVALDRVQNKKAYWKCVCDCGLSVVASGNNLRSGNTKSCGCLRRETATSQGKANTVHGNSHGNRTRLYTIWCCMRQRCNNPNRDAYQWYGSKGVTICEEWNDFEMFKKWALSTGYTDDLTIDRIDANKGYNPDNCQWLTRGENTSKANKNHTTRTLIRGEGR